MGQELVAGRAGGDPSPWLWVIYDRDDPDDRTAVRAGGVQHTRLYAPAVDIAKERLADMAYRALTGPRGLAAMESLVCRVKREGDPVWAATVPGTVWTRLLVASPR